MLPRDYDVVIVGAGISGLITAVRIKELRPDLNILIVEKGPELDKRDCPIREGSECKHCQPCRVISGPGGAGSYSDGKLFFEEAGGYLEEEGDPLYNHALIDMVRRYFKEIFPEGLPGKKLKPKEEELIALKEKIENAGLKWKTNEPHHLGTENCYEFVKRMLSDLENKGVKFSFNTTVTEIDINSEGDKIINVAREGETIKLRAKYLVLAIGKGGSEWLTTQMRKLGVKPVEKPIPYIGVRLEALREVLNPLTALGGDPKVYLEGNMNRVKTHCFADGGYVIQINYENGITLVDGYSYITPEKKSPNSSLNILVNTTREVSPESWFHFLKYFDFFGEKGRPKLQRYGDFLDMIPSQEEKLLKNRVKPTLNSYTLEDINQALPRRIAENIIKFLDRLNKVIPGVNDEDNLIYAPAAEWYIPRWIPKPAIEHRMRVPGLERVYIVGDGAGLSQGIVMAATTGLAAAWAISKED